MTGYDHSARERCAPSRITGVVLAGFSGLVVVLGRPSLAEWTPVDVLRLRSLLGVSLGAVIFALLPLAFHNAGLTHAFAIGLSSFFMACFILAAGFIFQRSIGELSSESRRLLSGGLTGALSIIWLVAFLAVVLNAVGLVFRHEFGVYFLCLLWFLVVAVVQFARIILVRFRFREWPPPGANGQASGGLVGRVTLPCVPALPPGDLRSSRAAGS